MAGKNVITHVIFDRDGILIDTTSHLKTISENLALKYNKVWPKNLQKNFNETLTIDNMKTLFEQTLDIKADNFHRNIYETVEELASEYELMPGAERLVRHFAKHGIPMAIATAGKRSNHDIMTSKFAELLQPGRYMSHVVCGEDDPDVRRNKPDADCFLVCAQRFASPPTRLSSVLVVEDTCECARRASTAGMTALLVPSDVCPKLVDGEEYECDYVLSSLEHFDPQLFGLPAFE